MQSSTAIQLLDVLKRHVNHAVDEALQVLSGNEVAEGDDLHIITDDEIEDLADALAAHSGEWQETGREEGVSQRWPDGNVDTYDSYVTYRCSGGPNDGVNLALGTVGTPGKEGEVVGFVLGAGGGSRRPLTVFFPANDFDRTGERVSMIRGKGGGNSRKGYGPDEPLPPVYSPFKTELLASRIKGKWNVMAVVAGDDAEGISAMLNHTAIQARLRGLI
jgi:hypothetical protein